MLLFAIIKQNIGQKETLLPTNHMEMNELKKVYIKNRTSYYFDDMIKMKNFGFHNVLMDEKSYENNFIYKISYETLIGANPLHIRFDKVDRFIRVHG